MMRVLVINDEGGGFADFVGVPHGTTVDELFHRQLGDAGKPNGYLIRVNRKPVAQLLRAECDKPKTASIQVQSNQSSERSRTSSVGELAGQSHSASA